MASLARLWSISYDILTIFISIADVATDIVVLVDFYEKERWIFFWISLSILILAQCGYSIAFLLRFNTIDGWGCFGTCCAFLCMLPFGTFVAFCMYFSDDDFPCFKDFMDGLDLSGDNRLIETSSSDSALTAWLKRKLQRHFGFVLEAVTEAFPQSLLQIIAIVYYQEANYVSIISILLSMTSVVTKSLILSKGLEKYTFVWTWLCVVSDFFGIFFVLTWVFYAHDAFDTELWGYFSIFGELWLWKFAVSVLLPVGLLAAGFLIYFVFAACVLICDGSTSASQCAWICFGVCLGPIVFVLGVLAACIAAEVFCFALLAMFVYVHCTDRFAGHHEQKEVKLIGEMIDFISNGNRSERVLRILALNFSYYQVTHNREAMQLHAHIEQLQKEGYHRMKQVTYYEIRENAYHPSRAHLLPYLMHEICAPLQDLIEEATNHRSKASSRCINLLLAIVYPVFAFILFPTYLMAKLFQACYPWIILGYLWYFDLFDSVHMFQLVMLFVFLALQMTLLLLAIPVCRINYWMWHFVAGDLSVSFYVVYRQNGSLMKGAKEWYELVIRFPVIERMIVTRFGNDIGTVILDYLKSIDIDASV